MKLPITRKPLKRAYVGREFEAGNDNDAVWIYQKKHFNLLLITSVKQTSFMQIGRIQAPDEPSGLEQGAPGAVGHRQDQGADSHHGHRGRRSDGRSLQSARNDTYMTSCNSCGLLSLINIFSVSSFTGRSRKYHLEDGYVDPYSVTQAIAAGARMHGAKIYLNVNANFPIVHCCISDLYLIEFSFFRPRSRSSHSSLITRGTLPRHRDGLSLDRKYRT